MPNEVSAWSASKCLKFTNGQCDRPLPVDSQGMPDQIAAKM
jgi:hypothetical protein